MTFEEQQFKSNIEFNLKTKTKTQVNNLVNSKPPEWLYPLAKEKSFKSVAERTILTPLRQTANMWLDMNLRRVILEDGIYLDDLNDDLEDLERELNSDMDKIFNPDNPEDSSVWNLLLGVAGGIYLFNEKQWNKQTERLTGIMFSTDETWWPEVEKSFVRENYNRFKGLKDESINRISEIVSRGRRNGMSLGDIREEIRKTFQTYTDNRIKFWARDQTGKLNGLISEMRMTEVGMDLYTWRTVSDERVRGRPGGKYPKAIPSHWEMEGMICKFSDSFVYAIPGVDTDENGNVISWRTRTSKMPKVRPGEDYQCRCTAIPYMPAFLNNIGGNNGN